MHPNNSNLSKIQDYTDGKYSVYTFSGDNRRAKRLVCESESICILPFDLNEHNQIKHLYVAKYQDYLSNGVGFTCITDTLNKDEFDSYYDAVDSCLKNEMGLNQVDVNDVYFLGKVQHSLPFSKEFRCYGINLSKYAGPEGFIISGINPNAHIVSIEKIRFNRLLKGEVADSLALSCAMLLLSYLSE